MDPNGSSRDKEGGLRDLGFTGPAFTWCKRKSYPNTIKTRLDRGMATHYWMQRILKASVEHLSDLGSNHRPVLISLTPRKSRHPRKFFFDNRWGINTEAIQLVENNWTQNVRGSLIYQVHEKLKSTRHYLFHWPKHAKTNSHVTMHALQNEIEKEKSKPTSQANWDTIRCLEQDLMKASMKEEKFWYQKSGQMFQNYLSSNSNGSIPGFLYGFPSKISEQTNSTITRKVSQCEIRKAVSSLHPSKALGSDGLMIAYFFQRFWYIIGDLVTSSLQDFFINKKILRSVNHTLIALIPKIQHSQKVEDLRPISLCIPFYKIISKILSQRLQQVLPNIIGHHQNAFVKGRSISDYILIAHEVIHHLRSKRTGNKSSLALKLEISKAYDRVEWGYLSQILIAWGFSSTFNDWIMEWLSHKINQAATNNIIKGVQISRYALNISHLFFADDSHIHPSKMLILLGTFSRCFQIMVKPVVRSSIMQSQHPSSVIIQICIPYISALLHVQNISTESTYLGLPPYIMRSKHDSFKGIISRIEQKLLGCKESFLYLTGKETLLKAVIAAIPIYTMMFFKLPRALCSRINSLMAQFWWVALRTRRTSWVACKKICRSKWEGGLGFKDFSAFNQALLGKQTWRVFQNQDSLLFKVLKGKYFHDSPIWKAPLKSNSSWGWRSLWHGLKLLNQDRRWHIANGYQVNTLTDPWIPSSYPFVQRTKPSAIIPRQNSLHHHNSGLFTVKSGYYIALNNSQDADTHLDPLLSINENLNMRLDGNMHIPDVELRKPGITFSSTVTFLKGCGSILHYLFIQDCCQTSLLATTRLQSWRTLTP
ncbi:uncharacterized protein LOC126681866 [Mercurialis annua]|uniref:uncharacterized protein LOC126681866 n=1 Tax=Mercurialis annua TaxID=3986 RepID=UPI00215FA949|nr:uncharacterized protein LOC126681866 [Mercurialis annua]